MPQPKSRKIAILGYRSVGECRTLLNAGGEGKSPGEAEDKCARPLGSIEFEAFAPPNNNRLRWREVRAHRQSATRWDAASLGYSLSTSSHHRPRMFPSGYFYDSRHAWCTGQPSSSPFFTSCCRRCCCKVVREGLRSRRVWRITEPSCSACERQLSADRMRRRERECAHDGKMARTD